MHAAEDPAVQLALEQGLLTPAQLAAARRRFSLAAAAPDARPRLRDFLEQEGVLDGRRLARALADKLGLPLVNLRTAVVAPEALAALARPLAVRLRAFPLAVAAATLRVAVSDPFDFETLDGLGRATRLAIEPAVAAADEIRWAIDHHYGRGATVLAVEARALPDARPADGEAPVIRLVEDLLREAVARRASDVHLEPLDGRLRVRFRVDGVLQAAADPPRQLQLPVISRLKLVAGMSIAEKRRPQDGRARVALEGLELDLRLSALPTVHGESVVIRLLDSTRVRLGLAELGLQADDQQTLERLLALTDGLVLATGPTGSGKTTTLYACLHHLNRPDRKIITVEDPVEYELAGVNQVPVRRAAGLTFAAALRAMLRQAPNIVMVGEIRDRETAEIAMNAALTGHLVFSTLHTNDAAGAVTRLVDIGVPPFLVASALRAVIAQRLVRRVCPHCAGPPPPAVAESEVPGVGPDEAAGANIRPGAGCPACEHTGYRGCVGLFEILPVDGELQRLIHEGAGAARLRAHACSRGMRTLRGDGLHKARAGLTTLAEVLAATVDDPKLM